MKYLIALIFILNTHGATIDRMIKPTNLLKEVKRSEIKQSKYKFLIVREGVLSLKIEGDFKNVVTANIQSGLGSFDYSQDMISWTDGSIHWDTKINDSSITVDFFGDHYELLAFKDHVEKTQSLTPYFKNTLKSFHYGNLPYETKGFRTTCKKHSIRRAFCLNRKMQYLSQTQCHENAEVNKDFKRLIKSREIIVMNESPCIQLNFTAPLKTNIQNIVSTAKKDKILIPILLKVNYELQYNY